MHIFFFLFVAARINTVPSKETSQRGIWKREKRPSPIYEIWSNESDHENRALFDNFSLVHFSSGLLVHLVGRLLWALAGQGSPNLAIVVSVTFFFELAWEMYENSNRAIQLLKLEPSSQGYNGDSWLNIVGDVFITMMGAVAGHLVDEAHGLAWIGALLGFLLLEIYNIFNFRYSTILAVTHFLPCDFTPEIFLRLQQDEESTAAMCQS